jgi:hypothetical protein
MRYELPRALVISPVDGAPDNPIGLRQSVLEGPAERVRECEVAAYGVVSWATQAATLDIGKTGHIAAIVAGHVDSVVVGGAPFLARDQS